MGSQALLAVLLVVAGRSAPRPSTPKSSPPSSYVFAQVQRVDVGDGPTRVSAMTNLPTPRRGYFPLPVFVDNSAGPRQSLKIAFHPNGTNGRPVSRTVEVAQGERRTVVLPVPYLFRYGALRVRGPGVTLKGDQHVYYNSTYAPQRAVLALGTTVEFERWVGRPPGHSTGDLTVHAIAAADAPAELAAYAGYETVALPAVALESLGEAQRRALEAYAATGGTLVLGLGGRGLAAALPMLRGEPEGDQPYGLGRLVVCEGCQVNLGSFFAPTEPVVAPRATPAAWQRNANRFGDHDGPGEFAALLPQASAPIGRFLIIIGLFTLAIGPGSLWVARRRGPAALLLTIPVTAFVTCATIIGYSLIQDGFTVHASTQGFTLLDSRQHRALQVGLTAYYANLAPGSARFSNQVAIMSPAEGTGEVYGPGIDWSESATVGSDFVPSRTYREWGYLSAEPTRARVVIKRKDGGWAVQNALGTRLASLVFMADDAVWKVEGVRDGAEGVAAKSTDGPLKLELGGQDRFSAHLWRQFERPLKEGEFLARLDGQGFTPTGGLRLSHHDSAHLVRGEVER